MPGKYDPTEYTPEESSSAYRDAYFREAPQSGHSFYGYSPAQCYARVSGSDGAAVRHRSLPSVALIIIASLIAAGLLAFCGLLFLLSADASNEAASTESEIYEDFSLPTAEDDSALALNRTESDSLQELTAAEIYTRACRSTVGVTIPGYALNIFGQTSAATVTGTGIILTDDGYVLTNFHVIEDAYESGSRICVITFEGSEHEAEVIGIEIESDLAVLKIEADGLTAAEIGDSDNMLVGQTIYAVGNPLGELTYTMTSGIVSALDRRITTDVNVTVNMFQIDAAVNNGNSGGPVFNVYGQVIGVVTAKYSQYGMEGLGFAIPVNDACDIALDLIEKGYVTGKAYLGLTFATISPAVARYYGISEGVYVYAVEEGSCAEEAGLMAGDVITAIDDVSVLSADSLAQTVRKYRAGDSAVLTVQRDKEFLSLTVVFDEELPASSVSDQPVTSAEPVFHMD